QVDRYVGDGVWKVRGAFDRRPINTVLDQSRERRTGHDRLPNDDVPPASELALRVQARLELVKIHGPIQATMDIVLARPLKLDGRAVGAVRFGDRHRFDDVIGT